MDRPSLTAALAPHLASAALHGLRLLPAALVSPLLGGPLVPAPVRLAIALGMGVALHRAGGSGTLPWTGLADLTAAAGRELLVGIVLGALAALPLEAARAGGRLVDTLRGATLAELHVAPVRQRESATGDLLAQWTVALAAWSGLDRLVWDSVLSTYSTLPVGRGAPPGPVLEVSLRAAGELAAAAIAIGTPAAVAVLAADLALACSARAAPDLGVPAASAPARAALGIAAVALGASAAAGRLLSLVAEAGGLMGLLSGGSGPR
jgi:type III secretory pathway component EscT